MECQVCKTRLEEDDLFCINCGTKRNVDETKSLCLNCGHFLKDTDLFCSKCGQSVQCKCLACGEILQKNHRFCANCGEETCPLVKRICELCGNIIDDVTVVFCNQCGASVAAGPSLQKSTEYSYSKVYVQPDNLHISNYAKNDILEITSTNPPCESISDVTQSKDNVHGTKTGYLAVGAALQSESCEDPFKESPHRAFLEPEEKIKLLLKTFNSDHKSSDKIPTQCIDEQREAFRFNKATETISSEHATIITPDVRILTEPAITTLLIKGTDVDVDIMAESSSSIVNDKATDVEILTERTVNTTATGLSTCQIQDHLVDANVTLLESGPFLVKADDIFFGTGPQSTYKDTLGAQGGETENPQNRTPSTEESTDWLEETENLQLYYNITTLTDPATQTTTEVQTDPPQTATSETQTSKTKTRSRTTYTEKSTTTEETQTTYTKTKSKLIQTSPPASTDQQTITNIPVQNVSTQTTIQVEDKEQQTDEPLSKHQPSTRRK